MTPTSSDTLTSQGTLRCRRTGTARLAGKVPINTTRSMAALLWSRADAECGTGVAQFPPGELAVVRCADIVSCDEHSRVDERPGRHLGRERFWSSPQGMARPPRDLAARSGARGTNDAAPCQLYRVRPGDTEPGHGLAARCHDGAAAAAAERTVGGGRLCPGLARARSLDAGPRGDQQRPRLHAVSSRALSGVCCRPLLELAPRQPRCLEPDGISARAGASGDTARVGQSGNSAGIPGRTAALYRQSAGSRSLLCARRPSRCQCRWHVGDSALTGAAAVCRGRRGFAETMPPEADRAPVLPIHFRRGDTSLRLFTTIATLGTPRDVTLEEIRIEFFFPIDDATAQAFGRWAEG